MSSQMPFLPQFESLETKSVQTAGASIAPAAAVRIAPGPLKPLIPFHDNAAGLPSTTAPASMDGLITRGQFPSPTVGGGVAIPGSASTAATLLPIPYIPPPRSG